MTQQSGKKTEPRQALIERRSPAEPHDLSVLSRKSFTAHEEPIMAALTKMAIKRGGMADQVYLRVFMERLSTENPTDVFRAIDSLADRARREGETALPDMGTILDWIHKRGVFVPTTVIDTGGETLAELAERNGADPSYIGTVPDRLKPKTNAQKLEEAGWPEEV